MVICLGHDQVAWSGPAEKRVAGLAHDAQDLHAQVLRNFVIAWPTTSPGNQARGTAALKTSLEPQKLARGETKELSGLRKSNPSSNDILKNFKPRKFRFRHSEKHPELPPARERIGIKGDISTLLRSDI
jgi:hypothetical protein